MTKSRIVAAGVNTLQLTLYLEDGSTIDIPQGNKNLKTIIDLITPIISAGGVAELDLDNIFQKDNHYSEFERNSGGLVKLFRVAKKAVASFFKTDYGYVPEPVEPTVIGSIPQDLKSAIDEVMEHAVPVSSADYSKRATTGNETIIAVVNDKIIPGVENLERQMATANKLGSVEGVNRFLERLAAVIDQREHSVHDLLLFMERGDLPIADDGSIIIYKVLTKHGRPEVTLPTEGVDYFYDIHTKKVPQCVGSYVCMDVSIMDISRRLECSTGLHVARRAYIQSFNGDVCTLCKVAPEDVIAVPHGDPNKMRVSGYHILSVLPADAHALLKKNRPMQSNQEAMALLNKALKGDHIGKVEETRIGGRKGSNITMKVLEAEPKKEGIVAIKEQVKAKLSTKAKKKKTAVIIDVDAGVIDTIAEPVNPVDVQKQADAIEAETKAKADAKPNKAPKVDVLTQQPDGKPRSRSDEAFDLFMNGDWPDLLALKRRHKISWERLGFLEPDIAIIKNKI